MGLFLVLLSLLTTTSLSFLASIEAIDIIVFAFRSPICERSLDLWADSAIYQIGGCRL